MIFLDDEFYNIIEIAKKEAVEKGFSYREPSHLLSKFWKTNFTPSSFEIAVRELKKNFDTKKEKKIFSIQPCVRVTDIYNICDGLHLLYFHMFTFFVINPQNVKEDIKWFFSLLKKFNNVVDNSFFSYYRHKYYNLVPNPLFENFGFELLKSLNIPTEKLIPCSGLDNYQITYNFDSEDESIILTEGPRIEIFVRLERKLIEYGTLILSRSTWINNGEKYKKQAPPLLAMVFGIERIYQAIKKIETFTNFSWINAIKNEIINYAEISELFSEQIYNLVILMFGLLGIAQNTPAEFKPGGKGANYELKKLIKIVIDVLDHIGIHENLFFEIFAKSEKINNEILIKLKNWFNVERNLISTIRLKSKNIEDE